MMALNFAPIFFTLALFLELLGLCSSLKVNQIKGIQVYEDIIKSPNDHLSYRGLELANGMKILIVNDPGEPEPSVFVDVNVGYLSYPKNVPGLARFLDDQVILEAATQKYPEKRQFLKFLKKQSKEETPFLKQIYASHTKFIFSVKLQTLPEALDRFAQLCISPIFSSEMFKRKVHKKASKESDETWNVEMVEELDEKLKGKHESDEDESNEEDSIEKEWIYPTSHPWQYLIRSLSNKTHEFYLSTNEYEDRLTNDLTKKTVDALNEMTTFYENYCSANLMTMVIMSNQSLDDITAMVVPIFSAIPTKQIAQPSWSTNPFGPDQLGYLVEIETQEFAEFKILFPTDDYSSHFRSKPWAFISHILDNWGRSILEQELIKNKKLLFNLNANYDVQAKGIAFFEISGMLTPRGLKNFEEVVGVIMEYISYVKTEKIRKWIVKDIEEELSMMFKYFIHPSAVDEIEFNSIQTKYPDVKFAGNNKQKVPIRHPLVNDLHDIPPNYWAYHRYVLDEFRPDLIEKFLSHLNADNMNIYIFSGTFKGKTDRVEKWFNTKYKVKRISEDVLKKLRFEDLEDKKFFKNWTELNPFQPENFDIVKSDDLINSSFPQIIQESALSRIWHLKDDVYLFPKVYLFFKLRSPVAHSSPSNSALCFMFSKMMEQILSQATKDGLLGHLQSDHMSLTNSGISLSVKGYNDKMPEFIASLFEFMSSGNFRHEYFLNFQKFPFNNTNYANGGHDSSIYRIMKLFSNILISSNRWSPAEFYDSLKEITFEQIEDFKEKFFSNLHIELFAYGNVNREGAINLMNGAINSIQKRFTIRPLLKNENQRTTIVSLPEGKNFLYETFSNDSPMSAVHVTFQANQSSIKDIALNALISMYIRMSCNDLAGFYRSVSSDNFLHCAFQQENGIHKIQFYMQDIQTPEVLDLWIEAIIKKLENKAMKFYNSYSFEELLDADPTMRLEFTKNESMLNVASRFWPEIFHEQYFFNRRDVIADAIRNIYKDEVTSYLKEILSASSPKRRKLAIYMYSMKDKNMIAQKMGNRSLKYIKIDDAEKFKSSLPFYELPKPFVDIPLVGDIV